MKQQHAERKRGLAVLNKLDELKKEEREKIKSGKKPFFLKESVKKVIAMDERWVKEGSDIFHK